MLQFPNLSQQDPKRLHEPAHHCLSGQYVGLFHCYSLEGSGSSQQINMTIKLHGLLQYLQNAQLDVKTGEDNVKICSWCRKVRFGSHVILSNGLLRTSQTESLTTNGTFLHVWRIQKFLVFPAFFKKYYSSHTVSLKKGSQFRKKWRWRTFKPKCLWMLKPSIARIK